MKLRLYMYSIKTKKTAVGKNEIIICTSRILLDYPSTNDKMLLSHFVI